MAETVQFWLDNKMSAGIRMAAIGELQLVAYRERYYVVEKGAAQMKGSKPLAYSKSSMPLIWKKALRGEDVPATALQVPADDALPDGTAPRAARPRKETAAEAPTIRPPSLEAAQPSPAPRSAKPVKPLPKAAPQSSVAAECPYCRHRHDLPLDKGKNGRPFFVTCAKCRLDFAVRLVPVTVYQAQVAGFK